MTLRIDVLDHIYLHKSGLHSSVIFPSQSTGHFGHPHW